MSKQLGHGRKIVRVKILEAIEPREGHKGLIVMIEGRRVEIVPERQIIDSVLSDFEGRTFMPEEHVLHR